MLIFVFTQVGFYFLGFLKTLSTGQMASLGDKPPIPGPEALADHLINRHNREWAQL